MRTWKTYAAGLLLTAGLSPAVRAQAVVPPAAAAAAAPGASGAAPAAAPQANLWSFICLTPEQKAACKDKLCNCALGQMLNNGLGPVSMFSGGLIPQMCPAVKAADLAKPADSPEGAAARAKADEADAKARREAVRFLGTVDCHYWPEAQEALINALRGDRNECVRLEAAFALNRGCCCTKTIIKALVVCVARSDEDGFPSERSERVRNVAHTALEHCLACYTEIVPITETKDGGKEPPPPPKETIPVPKNSAKPAGVPDNLPANLSQQLTPADYYKKAQTAPREQVIAESRHVLARLQKLALQPATASAPMPQESTPRSVVEIMEYAFNGSTSTSTTATVVSYKDLEPTPPIAVTTVAPVPAPIPSSPPITPALLPTPATITVRSASTPPASAPAGTPSSPIVATPINTTPATSSPVVAHPTDTVPPSSSVATPSTPVAARPMPASLAPQAPPQVIAKPSALPQAPVPVAAASTGMNMSLTQVIGVLRESPHIEYREWAAENLGTVDGWTNPEAVQALTTALRSDRAPAVRAASVRALGRMHCATLSVLSAVQAAKADSDNRVRREAELAQQLIGGVENVGHSTSTSH